MAKEPNRTIIALKIVKDLLIEFDHLVENISKISKKYGMALKDIASFGFGNPQAILELTKVLPAEKLGTLLIVGAEFTALENDLKNFMNYDEGGLQQFHERMIGIIAKLDKVVEGV